MKVIIRKSIDGGRADKITCADLAKKYNVPVEKMQDKLQTGITVEMEHTDKRSQAREIAMDHLSEKIDYYDKLEAAGLADELEKSVKDLSYWKKKLMSVLSGDKITKSIIISFFLRKGRSYPIGTKRTWNGKDYKKVAGGPSGKGKWMRSYSGKDDRGERQAVRNVMKKIQGASSMGELSEIVSQNMSRFKDDSGKILPIVKDFMTAARGTTAGAKAPKKLTWQEEDVMALKNVKENILPKLENVKLSKNKNKIDFSYGKEDYTFTERGVLALRGKNNGKTTYSYGGSLNSDLSNRERTQLKEQFKSGYDHDKQREIYGIPEGVDSEKKESSEDAKNRKIHENRGLGINKINLKEAQDQLAVEMKTGSRRAMIEALERGIKQLEDVIAGKEKKEPPRELEEPKEEPEVQEDSYEIREAKNKIRILQKKQKKMKDVNKIAKKKNVSDEEKIKQLVSELGLKESTAKLVMEPDYMGRTGFASFELTNNNAKIKAAINKITDLERRAEQKETFKPIEFDGGSIDIQDDRVVIDHDIKPDRDIIQKLKGRGFRWTPSIGAWTRKHTRQAVYDAKDVLGLQKSRIIIRGESLQKAKYITKKMVNGKWVYKYQEEKGKHGATNTPDLFISPDKFDAGAYFAKTDDPTATAESIMAKASPELRAKIAETEARLKKITPTINNHRTSGEGAAAVYTPERQKIHESIILKMLSSDKIKAAMPKQGEQPTFTMLGGRGGSGKSWFNGKVYNPETTIVMDSDEIKGQLPEYEGWNAFEVHEESSDILEKAVAMAKSYGLNIVIDATMKTTSSAVERVLDFKKSGYNIKAHYMHAPRQVSAKRAVSRFNGASGRYVPVGVVLSNTSNEKTFDAVKNYASSWSFHDSSGNPPPELISRKNGALKMAKAINTTKETSKRDPHDMYDFGPITDPKDYSEDLKRMIEKNRPGTIKKSRIVVRGNSSKK